MIFQVDTTKLRPGDSISGPECESVIGFTEESDPKAYGFELLKLLGVVQKQLKKEHSRELTVRIVGGRELHILTDAESAEYNPRRFAAGLRLARRAHRRLLAVNVAKLSGTERESYAKSVSNQAHQLSMLRRRGPDVPLVSAERKTPVMVFGNRKK